MSKRPCSICPLRVICLTWMTTGCYLDNVESFGQIVRAFVGAFCPAQVGRLTAHIVMAISQLYLLTRRPSTFDYRWVYSYIMMIGGAGSVSPF
jgi:hypothetical protein